MPSFAPCTVFKVVLVIRLELSGMFRRGLVVVRGWGERGFKFTRARLNRGQVFKTKNSSKTWHGMEWMESVLIRT